MAITAGPESVVTDYRDFYRELRTDWLKLRGCLFDPVTQLPSLPTVLDGVRRRLEAGDRVGLIYLDPSSGGNLESTHGWQAYDRLIREVAEALRRSRVLGRPAKETLALVGVRSDEFVAFPRLGGSGGDPSAQLERLRAALVEEVRARLDGRPDVAFRAPLQSSAVELEIEPTIRIERSIYSGLEQARDLCRQEVERRHSGRLAGLEHILRRRDLVVRYQPIVDLKRGSIYGLEALSMAPDGSPFESPDMLFSFAEQTDRILELDRLCRQEAMRRSLPLVGPAGAVPGTKLFLNCSAYVFEDRSLLQDLRDGVADYGLEPGTLVLEITERVAITEWHAFRQAIESLREAGVLVAIDDMGSGYSSLRAVAEIEPDYLKFDLSLISDIHLSAIKRELLSTLVTLAHKIGATPIAEGIEKREELETVRQMGIEYGQGYFFARPVIPADVRLRFPETLPNRLRK